MKVKNILFIHQSADLYGSDKVLLDLVLGLDKEKFYPILVLPEKGPLYDALIRSEIKNHFQYL